MTSIEELAVQSKQNLLKQIEDLEFVETPTTLIADAHADYLASLPKEITLYDTHIGQQAILWAKYGNELVGGR